MPRGLQIALALTAFLWVVAAKIAAEHASQGIALRFHLATFQLLFERLFLVFLLIVGFKMLDALATKGRFAAQTPELPARPGRATEWSVGAALGWGLSLAAVLPVLLSGHLHATLNLTWPSLWAAVVAAAGLLAGVLAQELIFRGYPFRRLAGALGETWAALLLSIAFALTLAAANPPRNGLVALIHGTLLGLLLTLALLRTNGLWVGWGLHFGYRAIAAVVLGLPIAGQGVFGSLADSTLSGPRWLDGGASGLDAAWLTLPVLLVGVSVLYRVTREYAWNYTHPLILPAGYEVEVAPPAAHAAMEREAPRPAPLVQILPATPQGGSAGES